MNIKTLFQVLKSVTELAGMGAIFISLLFVLQELHQARQTWIEREEALPHNREMMNSGQASWYQDVLNGLAKLEALDASPGIKK